MLIGRDQDLEWLESAIEAAESGSGAVALVAGEAGVGKTRFVESAAAGSDATFLRGAPGPTASPYGPVTAALRAFTRSEHGDLTGCGPLRPHLALLLPELGDAVAESDRDTLFEAIRCGFAAIAERGPTIVLLDDLHASDETTLDLLTWLAKPVEDMPMLVVGAYRSDEIPRDHPVRRLRNELRRAGALRERTLEPLGDEETAALASEILEAPVSPALAATLQDRTCGIPFFVEELASALAGVGVLAETPDGLDLAAVEEVPLPQTIRDAVLLHTAGISDQARATAEAAAVAGFDFDVELIDDLSCASGLDELIACGLVVDCGDGGASFRHPLARDALYEDVPWLRRRELHRRIAVALEARGGTGTEVSTHWLAARDAARALDSLLLALDELTEMHAYRDAAAAGRRLLDLWPDGERRAERIAVLERYARVAELAGDLAEATRAQREVVAARRAEKAGRALADAERRLASIYGLKGDRDRALTARQVAAEAYAANGLPGEAAEQHLVAAGYLQAAGRHEEARAAAGQALEEAGRAERLDLRARALGLDGVARVKGGDFDAGTATIRDGLALALDHDFALVAAEVYQRLGSAYEIAGDYPEARGALETAVGFCKAADGDKLEYVCLGCMAYVLRELGEWDRAAELSGDLIGPDSTAADTVVADGILGAIRVFRGEPERGLPLLARCLATSTRLDIVSMGVDSAAALAWAAEARGDLEEAGEHARFVLTRWARSEDHHYAVWGLRWAASFFARTGDLGDARACIDALSSIAAATGHDDAGAALAHGLGEIALADGDAEEAAAQMLRAVELHGSLEIPFELAQIRLRAAHALATAGRRDDAVDQLRAASTVARRLGARPLAAAAAAAVAELGESVEEQLGRRAAADHEGGGLSRRELEVIRLVATGRTNREIAGELVLSTRTVDMHVRNILTKLGCRTRTEAAGRAGDLGLLV
jgi:DNA-binding NarL/FixJ family response regulator